MIQWHYITKGLPNIHVKIIMLKPNVYCLYLLDTVFASYYNNLAPIKLIKWEDFDKDELLQNEWINKY